MSVIHFTTREEEVFPYWTKVPEIGLRRIMALIALASKTGLTGSRTPVVRDRNGRVIDEARFFQGLEFSDFNRQEKMHHQLKTDLFV